MSLKMSYFCRSQNHSIMNATMEKPLDYRVFLLGIVVYFLFDIIWFSVLSPLLFYLNGFFNPIAVAVGKSLLVLLVFYLLFRKPRMFNIRWLHVIVAFVLMMGVSALQFFISSYFYENGINPIADNMMDREITDLYVHNVRKWLNLLTSLIIIAFLWWRYDGRDTEPDADTENGTDTGTVRSFYGGMLFYLTVSYALWMINAAAGKLWSYVHYPVLLEVTTYLLLVLIAVCAVWMLVRKRMLVFPLVVTLLTIALHFYATHYLAVILDHFCTLNMVFLEHYQIFTAVTTWGDWGLFLAAFILYRREVKRENKAVETDV